MFVVYLCSCYNKEVLSSHLICSQYVFLLLHQQMMYLILKGFLMIYQILSYKDLSYKDSFIMRIWSVLEINFKLFQKE